MNMIGLNKKKKVFFAQKIAKIYRYFKLKQSSFRKHHLKIAIIITKKKPLNIKMK